MNETGTLLLPQRVSFACLSFTERHFIEKLNEIWSRLFSFFAVKIDKHMNHHSEKNVSTSNATPVLIHIDNHKKDRIFHPHFGQVWAVLQ